MLLRNALQTLRDNAQALTTQSRHHAAHVIPMNSGLSRFDAPASGLAIVQDKPASWLAPAPVRTVRTVR
jgi:hypothetical protein